MRNKGSALLITLIYIAILTTIFLSIGRSMVVQTRFTAATESSTVAYDLAEAGIEDALMRFRSDPKITICPDGDSIKRHKVLSSNSISASSTCINPDSQLAQNSMAYDLKISSKVKQLGFIDPTNSYAVASNPNDDHDPDNGNIRIRDGETLEFDVSGVNKFVTIFWEPDTPNIEYV